MKGHTIQQVRACAPAAPAGDTVEGPVGLRRKNKGVYSPDETSGD